MLLLAAAGIAALVERFLSRRTDLPVEVWRDVCPLCGHAEDGPDRFEVLARMGSHDSAHHAPLRELR